MAKHPVLSQFNELLSMIDTNLPYSASLIPLPGLLLLFRFDKFGPNRAMQLLEPQSLAQFEKSIIESAITIIETWLNKWQVG